MIWRAFVIIGFGFTAGVLGTWASDRGSPVDVRRVEVLTPLVRPGGDLKIKYDVYRRNECRTRLERILIDADRTRFVLDPIDLSTSPGPIGEESYGVQVRIPSSFAQGPAQYRAITVYICNPIHSLYPIVRTASEISFVVQGEPIGGPAIEVAPQK